MAKSASCRKRLRPAADANMESAWLRIQVGAARNHAAGSKQNGAQQGFVPCPQLCDWHRQTLDRSTAADRLSASRMRATVLMLTAAVLGLLCARVAQADSQLPRTYSFAQPPTELASVALG